MGRIIEAAPDHLVEDGNIFSGAFSEPVRDVNLLDAERYAAARPFWRMRMKEWCGIGFTHPDWYLSVMIQDAKYLGSGAVFVYNRHTREFFQRGWNGPGRSVKVPANQYSGIASATRRGFRLEFEHSLDAGRHDIHIDVAATRRHPAIKADLVLREDFDLMQPLVASLPVRRMHHAYTHKGLMSVDGLLRVGGEMARFEPARDVANMDEHKAIYPYHTRWIWGSFGARAADGAFIGVNLADHVFSDQERSNENCIWIGKELLLLGAVHWDMNPDRPLETWGVRDDDARVDLEFHPEGKYAQKANLLVAGIDYYQMCGTWTGRIRPPSGDVIEVPSYFGVAERMNTRF